VSSKEVFALRKEGRLDEAYQMALQRMADPNKDAWDDKALGWCLVDLIKRDVKAGLHENLSHYRQQLEAITVETNDEVLTGQRAFAVSLCSPDGQLANQAKQLSKAGRHNEAAEIYRKLWMTAPSDQAISMSYGWELYRIAKALLNKDPINLIAIKRNLNDYLKLNIKKPSLLHSCVLQVASKFAGVESFSMITFSRLWGLEHLRADDWERFVTDDRKELPSLAEKVIQQASKEATKHSDKGILAYILPHIDTAINEYPDNLWLVLNKAKVLLGLDRNDDALQYALEVTRAKPNDYWTWELLGDITADPRGSVHLSCYCKALLCSADDKFTGKVRLKLAHELVKRGEYSAAKYEINKVLISREQAGYNTPREVDSFVSQAWYAQAELPLSNDVFYRSHKTLAEDLLFSQFPWIEANLGEVYTLPDQEKKPKRRLYLKAESGPIEAVIPENKLGISNINVGDPIAVKGEWDPQNRFQVYTTSPREQGNQWDAFVEQIGVVDHVNETKKLLHFMVDRRIDGVIPFSDLVGRFNEGDAIAVKVAQYTSKQGTRYRVLTATNTDAKPPESLIRPFREEVRILNQLGFTKSDIFIPPPIIEQAAINDGDTIEGLAILNYNKKRNEWGWKALSIELGDPTAD